ncbi:MAG: DUF1624 domain-containing protein [Oligoflexia bacterium]|nr:DUF1624 domain-containing protein [Oligoflexia bacterium]
MSNQRIISIDVMRAIALIMMMLCHFVIFLTPAEGKYPWIYFFSNHIVGDFAAATFFFVMGASFAYVYSKKKEKGLNQGFLSRANIEKGFFVFLTGVVLTTISFGPKEIPKFDTLHFIGMSMIILALFRNISSKFLIMIGVISVLVAPLLRSFFDYSSHWEGFAYVEPLNNLLPNILMDPKADYSSSFAFKDLIAGILSNAYFPIFPWLIFPLIGFVFGRKIFAEQKTVNVNKTNIKKFTLVHISALTSLCTFVASIVIVIIKLGSSETNITTAYLAPYSFYPNTMAMTLLQLSVIIGLYAWIRYAFDNSNNLKTEESYFTRYCSVISRYSLTIYFVHIFIISKVATIAKLFMSVKINGESTEVFSEPVGLIIAILACFLIYFMSKGFDLINGRFSIEWMMENILPSKKLLKQNIVNTCAEIHPLEDTLQIKSSESDQESKFFSSQEYQKENNQQFYK